VLILAIPDDFINEVATILCPFFKGSKTIICHTSGTTDLEQISNHYSHAGIFYPLQSFSVKKSVNFREIPICINATNAGVHKTLTELAESLSEKVYYLNDDQRKIIHISAVFANNFSNYMYVISEKICNDHKLDFNMLRPLIKMTSEKIMENSAATMQTGPAMRKDEKVINEHLEFLLNYGSFESIYKILSEAISKHPFQS
jgi:predicted short-subunit dehydrogenase-like oxidoreductase (DUF2520 family)